MQTQIEIPQQRRCSYSKSAKMNEMFRTLFLNALKKQTKEAFLREHYLDNEPNEELLKNELSKPILSDKSIQPLCFVDKNETSNSNERDIISIMMSLYQLKDFERYLKFNGIKDETIRIAAGFLCIESYKAGEYIFRQGDPANKFYGIIKGTISIRAIPGNKIIREETRDTQEEERTRMNPGMCFGEWALIYKIPRTASAYCLNDVDLFYLNKDVFDSTLSQEIIKAELDKKKFVSQKIPLLKNCGRIADILSAINPLFFDRNDVVYSEFDHVDSLYVIYQGECFLSKANPYKTKEEMNDNKDSLVPVYHFDKGAILGLEIVNQNMNYSYTLVASQNYTVVYQLKYSRLQFLVGDIKDFLMPLFKIQESHIQVALNNFKRRNRNSLTIIDNHHVIKDILGNGKSRKVSEPKNRTKLLLKVEPNYSNNCNRNKTQTSFSQSHEKDNKTAIEPILTNTTMPTITNIKQHSKIFMLHKNRKKYLTNDIMNIYNATSNDIIEARKFESKKIVMEGLENIPVAIKARRRSMIECISIGMYGNALNNFKIDKKSDKMSYYDSGNYNLPLLSLSSKEIKPQSPPKKLKAKTKCKLMLG